MIIWLERSAKILAFPESRELQIQASADAAHGAAEILGVRRVTLSDLIHGKTSLSPEMALRLEKAFDMSLHTLLHMQAWYDSYTMRQRADEIDVRRYKPV